MKQATQCHFQSLYMIHKVLHDLDPTQLSSLVSCQLQSSHLGPLQFSRYGIMLSYPQALTHSILWPFSVSSSSRFRSHFLSKPSLTPQDWVSHSPVLPSTALAALWCRWLFTYLYLHQAVPSMRLASSSINICWINDNYSGLPWLNLERTTEGSLYKTF